MRNNELITWFDRFPTEIIFHIFEFLSNNDIIYAFFFFSQRLQNILLQNQCYINYFEAPSNLNEWKNILLIIGCEIECLNINTIDLFLPLKYFSNIKSLILSSPIDLLDEQIKFIIESEQFQNLHSFKIHENKLYFDRLYDNYLNNQNSLILKIFNSKISLEIFQYSLKTLPLSITNTFDFETNVNLHSLTLILTEFQDIFTLISFTPNLNYLNVQSPLPYRIKKPNKTHIKLKNLNLKIIENEDIRFSNEIIDFDQLFNGIKQFSSSLNCLALNLVHLCIKNVDQFPFNSLKLQQLLESMRELKQFHLYAKLNKDLINIDKILSKFNNKYWFDHNLSFAMHNKYFYTLPFYFDDLLQFYEGFDGVKSNNIEILQNNSRMWYNVKSIELLITYNYDLNFIKELKIKMPKLTSIKFGYTDSSSIHKTKDLFISNEHECKFDATLDNVMNIEFICGSIESKKEWLIHVTPNLRHLSVWFTELSSIDHHLANILNEKIQQLNISRYTEFEQLIMINNLDFSNVQHVIFGLDESERKLQDYADIIMKILKKFKSLKILIIYVIPISCFDIELSDIIQTLDINEISNSYQVQCFREYCLFSKK